ncbi:MAG: hypothetical protein HOG74_09960 [Nitrospina sp.]|nr:hypothetical protein [Nitrospina sp.]
MSPTSYQAAPPRIDFKFTTYIFIVQRWDRDYRFSEFCQEVIDGNLLLSKGATLCFRVAEYKIARNTEKNVRAVLFVAV